MADIRSRWRDKSISTRNYAPGARMPRSVIKQLPYETLRVIQREVIAEASLCHGRLHQLHVRRHFIPIANFVSCCRLFKLMRPRICASNVGSVADAENLVVGFARYEFEYIVIHACEVACLRILARMPIGMLTILRPLNQQDLDLICSFSHSVRRWDVSFDHTVTDLSCFLCIDQLKSLNISGFHGESLSAFKDSKVTSLHILWSPQVTDLIEVISTLPLLKYILVDVKLISLVREQLKNSDLHTRIEGMLHVSTDGLHDCYRVSMI